MIDKAGSHAAYVRLRRFFERPSDSVFHDVQTLTKTRHVVGGSLDAADPAVVQSPNASSEVASVRYKNSSIDFEIVGQDQASVAPLPHTALEPALQVSFRFCVPIGDLVPQDEFEITPRKPTRNIALTKFEFINQPVTETAFDDSPGVQFFVKKSVGVSPRRCRPRREASVSTQSINMTLGSGNESSQYCWASRPSWFYFWNGGVRAAEPNW